MVQPKKVGLGPGSKLLGRKAALEESRRLRGKKVTPKLDYRGIKIGEKTEKRNITGSPVDVYQKPHLFKGNPKYRPQGPTTAKRSPRYIDSTSRSTVESTARGGERGMRKTSSLGGATRVPRKIEPRRTAKDATRKLSEVRENIRGLRLAWLKAQRAKNTSQMASIEKTASKLKLQEKEILKKLGKK